LPVTKSEVQTRLTSTLGGDSNTLVLPLTSRVQYSTMPRQSFDYPGMGDDSDDLDDLIPADGPASVAPVHFHASPAEMAKVS
jgi:hypothetical protein